MLLVLCWTFPPILFFCKVRVVLRANQISCCTAFLKYDPKAHTLLMLHNPNTHMEIPHKTWCYLTLTLCVSLWPSYLLSFSLALYTLSHPWVVLCCSFCLPALTTHMSTNALTQEAPSVTEQWSRKLKIFLNSFITRGNVDMASFPDHNNRLPITAGKNPKNKVVLLWTQCSKTQFKSCLS